MADVNMRGECINCLSSQYWFCIRLRFCYFASLRLYAKLEKDGENACFLLYCFNRIKITLAVLVVVQSKKIMDTMLVYFFHFKIGCPILFNQLY